MDIREKYNLLSKQAYSHELINQVKDLRDQAILSQNREYYYLANLLIVDIYIDMSEMDEALLILQKDISDFDTATFTNIYVSYLERLIYIYIKKRHFKVAYRYVFEKRKFIDENNRQDINRWYLEMAYIYAEMNQKAKALDNLQAILINLPDQELLSHTLSNLTKLYIDEKMLKEAKETLNESLKVTHDEQGVMYCNYLYAQICVLEGKYKDAYVLFQEIFNGSINPDYVSIGNDYLDLLITMKKFEEAEVFINKMMPLLHEVNDLEIKKNLKIQKLKLILAKNNLGDASKILQDIKKLDEEIISHEEINITDTTEEDRSNEFYLKLHDLNERLERLISLLNIAFVEVELRDILLEFAKKLESLYQFEEVTFAIFDKLFPYQKAEEILVYNYKKERLYEKVIDYKQLKDSIIETILVNGHEIALDLTSSNLPLVDLFNQRKYTDLNIKYLLAIPFTNQTGLFFAAIFKAKNFDLTNIEHSLIFKIASSLLEKKIANYFIQEKLKLASLVNDAICDDNYLIYHFKDKIIFSKELQDILGTETSEVLFEDYLKLVIKGDQSKYQNLDFTILGKYELEYRLQIKNKFQKVKEKLYSSTFGGEIFYVGTLALIEEDKFTYDDDRFTNKVNDLKTKSRDLEFKFSFLRFQAKFDRVLFIQSILNSEAYYLSDDTIVVILENEVNQRTIEKYIKLIDLPVSVVRYPRDLMNIDDIIKYSKVSLENNILYFTDETYQKYLKKVSINNLVASQINRPIQIYYLKLMGQNKISYEVRGNIKGITSKDNARDYLDYDTLVAYDKALLANLTFDKSKVYYLHLSGEAIDDLITENKIKFYPNLNLCIDYYHKNLVENISYLKTLGFKIHLQYKLLDDINIFTLNGLNIDGLMVFEGLPKDKRLNLLEVARRFNFYLLTNYEFNDYDKCIYRTEEIIFEENHE